MHYQDMRHLMQNVSPDVRIDAGDGIALPEGKVERKPLTEVGKQILAEKRKALENKFEATWAMLAGPALEREYTFHATRKWRFDFADPAKKIAYEIQGGMFAAKSGHRSKQGVERDQEKLNAAVMEGWKVFQVNSGMINDSRYLDTLIEYHHLSDLAQ